MLPGPWASEGCGRNANWKPKGRSPFLVHVMPQCRSYHKKTRMIQMFGCQVPKARWATDRSLGGVLFENSVSIPASFLKKYVPAQKVLYVILLPDGNWWFPCRAHYALRIRKIGISRWNSPTVEPEHLKIVGCFLNLSSPPKKKTQRKERRNGVPVQPLQPNKKMRMNKF